MVAILKDVSACVNESSTAVEFSNTLQSASDSHEDAGHHNKSESHRKHHSSNNHPTATNIKSLPTSVSSISTIQDQPTSMQTSHHTIEPQLSLCNEQPISTSAHPPVIDSCTSSVAGHLSNVNTSSSGRLSENSSTLTNSDKTHYLNTASVNEKSTKRQ